MVGDGGGFEIYFQFHFCHHHFFQFELLEGGIVF